MPLLSRNVHRSALAITKSKGGAGIEPSVKRKRSSTALAHSNVPMNKIQIGSWIVNLLNLKQGPQDITLPDILGERK